MAQFVDFDGLLNDLFQGNEPIKENEPISPQTQKDNADFSKALSDIFQASESSNTPSLQECSLYVFMKGIIMQKFGMGYDYAIEINGEPVKSWFTIPELIEIAKNQGYELTTAKARAFLDKLISKRYIETDNYKYRRREFWNKKMEDFLLLSSK